MQMLGSHYKWVYISAPLVRPRHGYLHDRRTEVKWGSMKRVVGGGGVRSEWLQKLPEKKKPLYSHSLPCIEAWLSDMGFFQSKEDRSLWLIERPDWHAHLSLDVTDLYVRYLKNGPGNLERDVERKFSYALSREDLENAILGGP